MFNLVKFFTAVLFFYSLVFLDTLVAQPVSFYIKRLGHGVIPQTSLIGSVDNVYSMFLQKDKNGNFGPYACGGKERKKSAVTINVLSHFLNTYEYGNNHQGTCDLFEKSLQFFIKHYAKDGVELVSDVFFSGTQPFPDFRMMSMEELKQVPCDQEIREYELLNCVTNDFDGINRERFWKARHEIFCRIVWRWLVRDADFMKDSRARLEWKKFCELFDHGSDLKDFGSCPWLSEEGKLRSGPNWWWVVIPATVIVGAYVLNRYVQSCLPRKKRKLQERDALRKDQK